MGEVDDWIRAQTDPRQRGARMAAQRAELKRRGSAGDGSVPSGVDESWTPPEQGAVWTLRDIGQALARQRAGVPIWPAEPEDPSTTADDWFRSLVRRGREGGDAA